MLATFVVLTLRDFVVGLKNLGERDSVVKRVCVMAYAASSRTSEVFVIFAAFYFVDCCTIGEGFDQSHLIAV